MTLQVLLWTTHPSMLRATPALRTRRWTDAATEWGNGLTACSGGRAHEHTGMTHRQPGRRTRIHAGIPRQRNKLKLAQHGWTPRPSALCGAQQRRRGSATGRTRSGCSGCRHGRDNSRNNDNRCETSGYRRGTASPDTSPQPGCDGSDDRTAAPNATAAAARRRSCGSTQQQGGGASGTSCTAGWLASWLAGDLLRRRRSTNSRSSRCNKRSKGMQPKCRQQSNRCGHTWCGADGSNGTRLGGGRGCGRAAGGGNSGGREGGGRNRAPRRC